MKKLLLMTLLSSTLILSACGDEGPSEDEIARQTIYDTNVSNTPELTEEEQIMITESRGVVIGQETGEGEEVIEVRNSFSPGESAVNQLAALTREELLELDATTHMEIFINGVIRDEYTVAAHTLYGAEEVDEFKQAFREGLLTEASYNDSDDQIKYIDRIGLRTDLKDNDVANHHVDTIINQLNRIFVRVQQDSNFGSRITVKGQVYPIELREKLQEVNDAAFEFVGVNSNGVRSRLSEDEQEILNAYYVDTFADALLESPISEEGSFTSEIGGFERREDGTWAPAQMPLFSWNLIRLVYGIR